MAFRYLFGPVPSRRLGLSLGVDLLPPKTCTLNCVYCECGKTTHLTRKRGELVPTAEVCDELLRRLSEPPYPEWVTFAGSGEPTLHTGLGAVADHIKKIAPNQRVAILTNGTLMDDADVRAACAKADLVAVSVDAASPEAFLAVNRPHPGLDLKRMLSGVARFRQEYSGILWAEVFLIPGANDSENELFLIKDALSKIAPDEIQLNTLDRPGAEEWVARPSQDSLNRAAEILGARIIGRAKGRMGEGSKTPDPENLILMAASRRPLTCDDVSRILSASIQESQKILDRLTARGQLVATEKSRGIFYGAPLGGTG